jgi:PiT family inorganic phosphate transporter
MDAFSGLTAGAGLLLVLALLLAYSFEFVNGFHDTANAVATVIYTKALQPWQAVIWSGCWNLIGVLISSGAVAFGILALLPVELVLNVGSGAGFAMVFALLVSAIIWNVGTWWFGLPASSSHTLIGAIMGVGLANSVLSPGHVFGEGVNWAKVTQTGQALLFSPLIGFVVSAILLLVFKFVLQKRPELFRPPEGDHPPTWWVRGLLVLTCTGVSFSHGSNDGQKGMGLVMLILIGIVPGVFAVNPSFGGQTLTAFTTSSQATQAIIDKNVPTAYRGARVVVASTATVPPISTSDPQGKLSAYLKSGGKLDGLTWAALAATNKALETTTAGVPSLGSLQGGARKELRSEAYLVGSSLAKLQSQHVITDAADTKQLSTYRKQLGVGEGAHRALLGIGHNDRLEAHRRDGRRADRQGAPYLRAGRVGRDGRLGNDSGGRQFRSAGQHDARALVGRRRYHGRQWFGRAGQDDHEHRPGLGADLTGVRLPRLDAVRRRAAAARAARRALTSD